MAFTRRPAHVIVGIGIDVVPVAQLARALAEDPGATVRRLFTRRERAACEGRAQPARRYAACFAAKEALLKALRTGVVDGRTWREAELVGTPVRLVLHGRLRAAAAAAGADRVHVSLAGTPDLAVAHVILETGTAPGRRDAITPATESSRGRDAERDPGVRPEGVPRGGRRP